MERPNLLPITSNQNPRLKNAIRLRTRRGREQQDRFLIDGYRELVRCLKRNYRVSEVFLCSEWIQEGVLEQLQDIAAQHSLTLFELPSHLFAKLAYGDRSDGIVTSAFRFQLSLASLPVSEQPLIVMMESLEKPGNVGAILRTADAAGADAAIHIDPRADWFNPNTIRASTGALFSVPFCDSGWEEAYDWAVAEDIQIVATRPDAEMSYTEVDFQKPTAIVLGSEADGLTDRWRMKGVVPVHLPMLGAVDSLNVSVTAAILLFEAQRQRAM